MIIGSTYQGSNEKFVNTLILILKRYIYVTKCFEGKLKFNDYMSQFYYYAKVEYYIASHNQKIKLHNKKMESF